MLMIKYQVLVHYKNWEYDSLDPNSQEYTINFKCVRDTISQCLDVLYRKYNHVMQKENITNNDLADCMMINRIDTEKCPKWEKMFLNID